MQIIFVLFAAFSLGRAAVLERALCQNDNCARALNNPRSSSRVQADCSSFQAATAYLPATTTTLTSGSTPSTIVPSPVDTTIFPTNVPSYAVAACTPTNSASARFASACSCSGVTKSTVTYTPTATVVVPTPTGNPQLYCDNPISRTNNSGGRCNARDVSGGYWDGFDCYCYKTVNSGNVCGPLFACTDSQTCTTDADCGRDNVCVLDTYCEVPKCALGKSCAAKNSPTRLFRKGNVEVTSAYRYSAPI